MSRNLEQREDVSKQSTAIVLWGKTHVRIGKVESTGVSHTITVFGLTNALQASLMISHAKLPTSDGKPPILHLFDGLVVVVALLEGASVVDVGLLEGACVVVGALLEGVCVVDEALVVMEVGLGTAEDEVDVVVVVTARLCFRTLEHSAVTVTAVGFDVLAVEVTSVMGTKDEQNAEAFKAIKIALATSTSPRGSS